jgi:large repetitive protein
VPGPVPTIKKLSPKKGPAAGGKPVTITGTGFIAVTAVKFGFVNAVSFHVNSAKSITAIPPEDPQGTVEVTVTTSNGTSGSTSKDRFSYEGPTVTDISPNAGLKAGGTAVTVTGTGFALGSGATAFKFGKGLANSVKCTSTTTCTMLSPAAAKAGTVDVTAKVSSGKSSKKNPADRFTYN